MQWKTTRKTSELKLSGIDAKLEVVDGSVRVVVLTDDVGNSIRVTSDYGLSVSVPQPPATVKHKRVHGTVAGLAVDHTFENSWDAEEAKRAYERKVADPDDAKLELSDIDVPVED